MRKRRLTVEAVVTDSRGRVLLVRQGRSRHDWELPGGKVRKEESLLAGLRREVEEETEIAILPQRLIGVYFIRDGNEIFHDFVFACGVAREGARPRPNPPEIAECGFFEVDQLPRPLRTFTRERIAEARREVSEVLPVELVMRDWIG